MNERFATRLETPDGRTTIGTGTASGEITDDRIEIAITLGAGAAVGSGQLHISVPDGVLPAGVLGQLAALDHSANVGYLGIVAVADGCLQLFNDQGREWTGYFPFTLAPNDTLHAVLPSAG